MRVFDFSQNFWQFIVMALVSYLIGCFNFARIIAKHKHKDITKIGSGNPGTMNMSREFGWKIGALTFVLDAVKGGIVVLAGHLLYQGYVFSGTQISVTDVARYFCGVFAVLGHIVPITAKFKGGKGIAVMIGMTASLAFTTNPLLALPNAIIGFGLAFGTRYVSMGSLGFATCLPISCYLLGYEKEVILITLAASALAFWRHRKNIKNLMNGTENRFGSKKK